MPGGKLVSVKVTYWKEIDSIQILGDFFVYPEEGLGVIERSLAGTDVKSSEEEISRSVQAVLDRNRITLVGLTSGSIAQAIRMAVK